MLVKHVMTSPIIAVSPDATLQDAARLMLDRGVSGLPVIDASGSLVGLLSEGDLLHRTELGTARDDGRWLLWLLDPGRVAQDYTRAHARRVSDAMSHHVHTVPDDAWLEEAVATMEQHGVRRLPVVHAGEVIGMLTRADLVRALAALLTPSYVLEALTDNEIGAAVRAELEAQTPIVVEVKDRVVTLRGTTFDERQRQAARVAAENVPGVAGVKDELVLVEPYLGVLVPASPDETRRPR
jgi:CBS domain-containing protein